MLVRAPGRSATVLVAFATSGDSPAATSAGKVRSVPPPAIALMIPARKADAAAMARRPTGMAGSAEVRSRGATSLGIGEERPARREDMRATRAQPKMAQCRADL